jgi:Barrel-sandwich domain of CusB or HlyD membrane-fusion
MIISIIALWMGLLFVFIKIGVFKGWSLWMKVSPLIIWLICNLAIFIPMWFGAPSGPLVIMRDSVQIKPGVPGLVTEVPVKSGVPLKKGDILFKLDTTLFQAKVDEIEAKLELAKIRLGQSERLVKTQALAAAQHQTHVAEVRRLEAQLTANRAALGETTVRAPADGFVPATVLRPGTIVSSSMPAMHFIDTSETYVAVQIGQPYLRHIKPGKRAEVTLKLYPGTVFEATVSRVVRANPLGQLTPKDFVIASDTIRELPFWVDLRLSDKTMDVPSGAVGTASIYTDEFKKTHIVRRIVLRMETWLNWLMAGLGVGL